MFCPENNFEKTCIFQNKILIGLYLFLKYEHLQIFIWSFSECDR